MLFFRLSELRSVKHSRDVRLRHESEQRQLGMRLLQRDVANLPAEAVEQLNQAQHTLCKLVYDTFYLYSLQAIATYFNGKYHPCILKIVTKTVNAFVCFQERWFH